jgi:linoleoyl-CoA desaturase
MAQKQETQKAPTGRLDRAKGSILSLEFDKDKRFETDLRRRVNEYFQEGTGRSKTANWQMYLKTAVIFASFVSSYLLLVFVAETIWQGLLLVILLGLSTVGIGFNIAHDGGHKAYSRTPWVNKVMARTMDLVGGSSYLWFWKHCVIHHRYVNITGYDTDIDLGVLGRVSPYRKRLWYYRWQHLYLWFIYGFLAVKWEFVDDFRNIISGRIGRHRFPRPTAWELAVFIGGKTVFFTWTFVIPLFYHPLLTVIFYYGVGVLVLGATLSVVFQLPHCVEEAEFPIPREDTGQMESPWAVHQANVTVDYGRHSPIMSWFLGGLNFHKEHHLFPTICHIHYPAITKIVEETCRDHGIKYSEHESFWAGIAAHYRWLQRMGKPNNQN